MNMDGAPEWLVVLRAWLVFVLTIGNSKLAAPNTEHAATKLAANIPGRRRSYSCLALLAGYTLTLFVHAQGQSGFISLDCGRPVNSSYIDMKTGLNYSSDATYVDTGVIKSISREFNSSDLDEQLRNVRSFPEGIRNCYKHITVKQGTKYLIRGTFMHGNYDGQDKLPEFDLHIGVNIWDSVQFVYHSSIVYKEIIHVSSSNYIQICLVNTGKGTPFISALELRPLPNDTYYTTSKQSLALLLRWDTGSITKKKKTVRYKDDIYDRIWLSPDNDLVWSSVNTSQSINSNGNKAYELPPQVMSTAATPANINDSLKFNLYPPPQVRTTSECFAYLHFAEFKELQGNEYREFKIYLNDDLLYGPVAPQYLVAETVFNRSDSLSGGKNVFLIKKTETSTLPPIINAIELYSVKELLDSETHQNDVSAITNIKSMYHVNKNWQGDPCNPRAYLWDGLDCDFIPPRIISLNLSSHGLTGQIAPSISNLSMIQTLDLSYNNLNGPIPDSLAQLPNLTTLYLNGNKLTGSVPETLKKKLKDGKLKLSVDENPVICQSFPCKKKKKKEFVIPVVASSVAVLILLFLFSALTIYKRKRHGGKKEMKQKMLIQELGGHLIKKSEVENDGQTSHHLQFLSFESITDATNNFSTESKLGEGGFGPVYKGKLRDGKEIAIKRLSRSSGQGLVEFKNEALLIAKLQHANLVRLLGFCVQEEEKLLIYEYMSNKSLNFFLFDSTKKKLLTWKIRFNIIEGVAQGLVYLHKYSRPRVIHRDLKASNILLDDEMNPKISDFGMAKIFGLKASEEHTNRVVGTYGYMSPEYAINGVVSIKTDVFSFGVLLLEIVSGKKNNSHYHSSYPINLIGDAWQLWNEDRGIELIDPTLDEACLPNEALRCIHIGLLCVQDHAADRPTMVDVVSMLSNETAQLTTPKQSAYFSNTVMEDQDVLEIRQESCSINDVTISKLETR